METKGKTIFLSGYYGAMNVGDDLLLLLMIENLLDSNPHHKISVLVKDPENIADNVKSRVSFITPIDQHPNKIVRALRTIGHEIRIISNHDVYIYGGGTRLFETGKRTYQSFLIKYIILLFNRLFLKRLIIHFSVGIGKVESRLSKFLLRRILILSDYMYFRDKASYLTAAKLLRKKRKIKLSADLAYLLYQTPKTPNRASGDFNIGLSFFNYYGYIDGDTVNNSVFVDQVVDVIKSLNQQGQYSFYFYSFQKKHGGNDEELNERIIEKLAMKNVFHIKYRNNPLYFVDHVGKMSLGIGMRYHFCLISLINLIPCIGISYQPKVKFEFDDLNLSDFIVDMDEIPQIVSKLPSKDFAITEIERKINSKRVLVEMHFKELNEIISKLDTKR